MPDALVSVMVSLLTLTSCLQALADSYQTTPDVLVPPTVLLLP